MQNFEKTLPSNFTQKLYINAKNIKFGLLFNTIAMLVFAFSAWFAFHTVFHFESKKEMLLELLSTNVFSLPLAMLVFCAAIFLYIVLHEIVHGIFYKIMTGEKLTFGISWSCAFCGVPNIYVYRKTALAACSAPLVIFTVLLLPLSAILYFFNPLFYIVTVLLFGLHLGGCAGDIYVILLLLFRYKNKKTLMRDTGPEQFFYVPGENCD